MSAVGIGIATQSTPALVDLTNFNALIAPRTLDYAMFMMDIDTDPVLWSNYQSYAASVGAIPITTQSSGSNTLNHYASGAVDTTGLHSGGLHGFALSAISAGIPIIMRPFHEFNGNWNSYGYTKETAAQYVAGWRHIHDIFTAAGVTNVKWMWGPNVWVPGFSAQSIDPTVDDGSGSSWYPGDAYVDIISLDGYMTTTNTNVDTPETIFKGCYDTLVAAIPTKPFAIAEFGCSEQSRLSAIGGKAGWYDLFFKMIREDMPKCILATQWERDNSPNDYTISSSGSNPAARAEFVSGVRNPVFVASRGYVGSNMDRGLALAGVLDLGSEASPPSASQSMLPLSVRYEIPSPAFAGIFGTPRMTSATLVERETSVVGVGATG